MDPSDKSYGYATTQRYFTINDKTGKPVMMTESGATLLAPYATQQIKPVNIPVSNLKIFNQLIIRSFPLHRITGTIARVNNLFVTLVTLTSMTIHCKLALPVRYLVDIHVTRSLTFFLFQLLHELYINHRPFFNSSKALLVYHLIVSS